MEKAVFQTSYTWKKILRNPSTLPRHSLWSGEKILVPSAARPSLATLVLRSGSVDYGFSLHAALGCPPPSLPPPGPATSSPITFSKSRPARYGDLVVPSKKAVVRAAGGNRQILRANSQRLQALLVLHVGVGPPGGGIAMARILLVPLLLEASRPEVARPRLHDGLTLRHDDPDDLRRGFVSLEPATLRKRHRLRTKHLSAASTPKEHDHLHSPAATTAPTSPAITNWRLIFYAPSPG